MRGLWLNILLISTLIVSSVACKSSLEAKSVTAHRRIDLSRDSDYDGFPDSSELGSYNDRRNFRRWFTAIAETQFYQISDQWNAEQRDCAGLVRFVWREALRPHDRLWYQRMGPQYDAVAPDVAAYDLQSGPLGERLFRTQFGTFRETDLNEGVFSDFADARSLKNFNCTLVGRERQQAEPGDLIFYYQPWVQKYPYHVMVFIGKARIDDQNASDWVVYHTGSSPSDEGTVKKVRLATLDHHPDKRWRPALNNPNFLGFYRLKILD